MRSMTKFILPSLMVSVAASMRFRTLGVMRTSEVCCKNGCLPLGAIIDLGAVLFSYSTSPWSELPVRFDGYFSCESETMCMKISSQKSRGLRFRTTPEISEALSMQQKIRLNLRFGRNSKSRI